MSFGLFKQTSINYQPNCNVTIDKTNLTLSYNITYIQLYIISDFYQLIKITSHIHSDKSNLVPLAPSMRQEQVLDTTFFKENPGYHWSLLYLPI